MLIKNGREFKSVVEYMGELAELDMASLVYRRDDAIEAAASSPYAVNADFYRVEVELCKAEIYARLNNLRLDYEVVLNWDALDQNNV